MKYLVILILCVSCAAPRIATEAEQKPKPKSAERLFLCSALGCFLVLYAITNEQPYKPK